MEIINLEDSEKIYLWTKNKKRMAIFRFSVYLKDEIIPELLQTAVNSTIKRFPSFITKFEKNFFDYYLTPSNHSIEIKKDNNQIIKPLEIFDIKTQCLRILYLNNRISVDFFHAITDGAGAMEFLKVLVAEYLKLRGIDFELDDNIMDINKLAPPQEYENPFKNLPSTNGKYKLSDKKAIQLDGKMLRKYDSYNINFDLDTNMLKSVSEKYNSTITVYLLSLMFIACKKTCNKSRGDINIQVPISLRKYHKTMTVRNFSMYCGIRLSISEINDVASIIDKIKFQLSEKASITSMEKMVTHIGNISKKLKYLPLFIKKPISKIGFKLYGERVFTITLSNIGTIKLPSNISKNVEKMDGIIRPQDLNRASCLVITCNNTTTFSINKRTKNPAFEKEMKELLEKDGLKVTIQDQ